MRGTNCGRQEGSAGSGHSRAHALDHCERLRKAGWSWGCVSAIDSNGRTIWIADAHRDDGKRFIVRADDILTAFLELETVIHQFAVDAMS
jgi:hypothetical protein